jgi:predicted SAM-dependent methyltransferase
VIAALLKKLRLGHTDLKLHLGSGLVKLSDWVNIDMETPVADMKLDLRQALPFDDNSVRFIFSEHFIEHITRDEALNLLRECRRVLTDGGVLRLSTPNLRWIVEKYLEKNILEWVGLWSPATPCQMMNEGMRSWGHQFVYDAEELSLLFSEAGFISQRWCEWRKSEYPELCHLEQRPFHRELIIEATTNP